MFPLGFAGSAVAAATAFSSPAGFYVLDELLARGDGRRVLERCIFKATSTVIVHENSIEAENKVCFWVHTGQWWGGDIPVSGVCGTLGEKMNDNLTIIIVSNCCCAQRKHR